MEERIISHGPANGKQGWFVSCPASAGNPIGYIPIKHVFQTVAGFWCAVEGEAESSVDHLAPSYPSSIVEGYPGSPPEAVTGEIVDGHIGEKISVAEIAAVFQKNPSYLNSCFKRMTGERITDYIARRKAEKPDMNYF